MGLIDLYTPLPGGVVGLIVHHFLRFAQFVLGITIIGLYATELSSARRQDKYPYSSWAYATAVGTFSAFFSLIYFIPFLTRAFFAWLWPLDACMWILNLALFADFASKYLHADPHDKSFDNGPGVQKMKNASWVDLVSMLLWFVTAVWGALAFVIGRKRGRTLHTGRAAL